MHYPPYDPKVPDRIDPWPIWCAAMHAYTARSERNLLTALTTLPEEYKDTDAPHRRQVQRNDLVTDATEAIWRTCSIAPTGANTLPHGAKG